MICRSCKIRTCGFFGEKNVFAGRALENVTGFGKALGNDYICISNVAQSQSFDRNCVSGG